MMNEKQLITIVVNQMYFEEISVFAVQSMRQPDLPVTHSTVAWKKQATSADLRDLF